MMSWNTETAAEYLCHSESVEDILDHLEAHYPHLQPQDENTVAWIEAALREDNEALVLSIPAYTSDDELFFFFWKSRRWVRDGYELLNQSLEDDWDSFEGYRPFFPEVQDVQALPLAA